MKLVCPIDGTELTFQNWDYYCPKCGHEFEDGEGAITEEQFKAREEMESE